MTHARFAPRSHRFAYRIFLFAIDLDELPALHKSLGLFSLHGPNVYSFRERDYLPPPIGPQCGATPATESASKQTLKDRVVAYAREQGIDLAGGRIVLVTLPRIAGTLFNPVSFYFCENRHGTPIAVLAEVTNTFREVKVYLAPARNSGADAVFRLRVPKHFYVSPFSDVDVEFDFQLCAPGSRLSARIDDYTNAVRTFSSTLAGTHRPLTTYRLFWYSIKYPLLTLRIVGGIHWHALLLWVKGVPWFPKAARPGDQREVRRAHRSLKSQAACDGAELASTARQPAVSTSFHALKLP